MRSSNRTARTTTRTDVTSWRAHREWSTTSEPTSLEVYLRLLHPEHSGHRRIEQERIPLTRALSEVERLVSPTN